MQREEPMTEEEVRVLAYLKNYNILTPESFSYRSLYGVNVGDIIKFIENPERYGEKPFVFVCKIYQAITKIDKNYIIPYPELPEFTFADSVVLDLLLRSGDHMFGQTPYFAQGPRLRHVLAYLQREKEIYTWEPSFVIDVIHAVQRVQKDLFGITQNLDRPST